MSQVVREYALTVVQGEPITLELTLYDYAEGVPGAQPTQTIHALTTDTFELVGLTARGDEVFRYTSGSGHFAIVGDGSTGVVNCNVPPATTALLPTTRAGAFELWWSDGASVPTRMLHGVLNVEASTRGAGA